MDVHVYWDAQTIHVHVYSVIIFDTLYVHALAVHNTTPTQSSVVLV